MAASKPPLLLLTADVGSLTARFQGVDCGSSACSKPEDRVMLLEAFRHKAPTQPTQLEPSRPSQHDLKPAQSSVLLPTTSTSAAPARCPKQLLEADFMPTYRVRQEADLSLEGGLHEVDTRVQEMLSRCIVTCGDATTLRTARRPQEPASSSCKVARSSPRRVSRHWMELHCSPC